MTSIDIPDNVTSIDGSAFYKCSGLTSVTIGSGVTSIGSDAFYGCLGLKDVYITDLAKWCEIDFAYSSNTYGYSSNPFYYADNLYINDVLTTDLVIPNDVTSIGKCTFDGCSGLTSVTISDSVTSIGSYAFDGCSGLTSIEIPDSVTSIGSYAFSGCSGLTSIEIPDSVTKIGEYAFSGCSRLTSVTIPDSVTNIGERAFFNCSGLTSVNYNASNVFSNIFDSNYNNILLIVLGDNVKSIDANAFASCSHLKRIIIPKSVTEIEKAAFKSCTSLTTVEYGGGQSDWDEIYIGTGNENLENANFVFNSSLSDTALTDADYLTYTVNDDDTLTITNCYENATSINIPKEIDGKTVTRINSSAFANRGKLRTVIIPDSVQSIGERAFDGCENLSSIIIPDGVTTIETNTFYNCGKLKTVSIPSSVTSIGSYAFYGCGGLTDVYYAGTDEQWKTVKIENGNDNLEGANFHYGSTAPEPIIPKKAKVTKTDAETAYSFDVSVERAYENSYVYAVTYDKDGVFINLAKVPLNMTGSTSVSVDKSENDAKAKVFVWTDDEQPISLTESFNL